MVLGFERVNARKSQPNANIVFIKPLNGPEEHVSWDFLERIAAQCFPIMKEHHLYVMSLEEFPPNNEFVGRNFNAGEVIQLVLKSPRTGRWLPFEYVQMVMMHELAHCKQMNHSRAFWAVRNKYANQMQELFRKGYMGEGLWGRGRGLAAGEFEQSTILANEALPEHLCGGTYRSRGRRKRKPVLSYQGRKQRRIEKKFGKHGMALGADDLIKTELEKGKKAKGKPRVAGSARGRELRAAAALARFNKHKVEEDEQPHIKDEIQETYSDSENEYDNDAGKTDSEDAVDVDGSRLVDGKGRGMLKICEDENEDNLGAMDEKAELNNMLWRIKRESPEPSTFHAPSIPSADSAPSAHSEHVLVKAASIERPQEQVERVAKVSKKEPEAKIKKKKMRSSHAITTKIPESSESSVACSMCSFNNSTSDDVCSMCANVLRPDSLAGSWKCISKSCLGLKYVNSNGTSVCGICMARRP